MALKYVPFGAELQSMALKSIPFGAKLQSMALKSIPFGAKLQSMVLEKASDDPDPSGFVSSEGFALSIPE